MRRLIIHSASRSRYLFLAIFLCILGLLTILVASHVKAADLTSSNERLITIHDRGKDKGILTKATTLRQAFVEAGIAVDDNDLVEPTLDETLVASSYQVNVYRARPVIIVDGQSTQKVLSPYQTSKQIVEHAGLELHDEDVTTVEPITDVISHGAGLQVTIDRATPFTLVLYGKTTQAYTQAKTVGEMMKQKDITLGKNETVSVPEKTAITPRMTVEIWRNGAQTITEEQTIDFPIEKIQDADREVGYREVKTVGEKGKKTVTYEVVMKNGKEESRKEIQSIILKEAKKQVEVVGAKPSFSGDFQAALAKLRSCEGGYNSWNPAGPYYGAYQFDERTWNGVTSAPYGNATPAQQDEAAYKLYLRRGWQPWPVCGAQRLPDIYR